MRFAARTWVFGIADPPLIVRLLRFSNIEKASPLPSTVVHLPQVVEKRDRETDHIANRFCRGDGSLERGREKGITGEATQALSEPRHLHASGIGQRAVLPALGDSIRVVKCLTVPHQNELLDHATTGAGFGTRSELAVISSG